MLGFQLRSSTNVPSCYCYALRVLCVALNKGGKAKKNKKKIKIEMLCAVACSKKISLFYHRRDIHIPAAVNIYIYSFIYLYK